MSDALPPPLSIPFSLPSEVGEERQYLEQALAARRLSGDRAFSERCAAWLRGHTGSAAALMTPSCTHALELAALLLDIGPGDEVIMPSFTFPSTANAFALRGARIVFVDIRPDTMNLDERLVEAAITPRTRAVVAVHYAGVACEMDTLLAVAQRHRLALVEDAAQALSARYRERPLGALSDFGTVSFHETKNFQCGEGGALLVNAATDVERAEIIREKGTDRSRFFRGEVDKYTWVDIGSSHLLGELNAAYLLAQLERAETVTADRVAGWERYRARLTPLAAEGLVTLPHVPAECRHNGHLFYLKCENPATRDALLRHLNQRGIGATFHYLPLHTAPAGKRYGEFRGEDRYTSADSARLLRLPLYYRMTVEENDRVCDEIHRFFGRPA